MENLEDRDELAGLPGKAVGCSLSTLCCEIDAFDDAQSILLPLHVLQETGNCWPVLLLLIARGDNQVQR